MPKKFSKKLEYFREKLVEFYVVTLVNSYIL